MNGNKPWYQSTAVIGSLVTLATLVLALFGVNLSEAQASELSSKLMLVGMGVGGVLSLVGRLKAVGPIGKNQKPSMTIEEWLAAMNAATPGSITPIPKSLEKIVMGMLPAEIHPSQIWKRQEHVLTKAQGEEIEAMAKEPSLAQSLVALAEAIKSIAPPSMQAPDTPVEADPAPLAEGQLVGKQDQPAGYARTSVLGFILAVALAWCLGGCVQSSGQADVSPESAAIQAERFEYGIKFLRESKAAVVTQIEAEKAANPAKASEIDAKLGPALRYYSSAVDAYDAAALREKQQHWDTARFILTGLADTAIRVGVPLAVKALTE